MDAPDFRVVAIYDIENRTYTDITILGPLAPLIATRYNELLGTPVDGSQLNAIRGLWIVSAGPAFDEHAETYVERDEKPLTPHRVSILQADPTLTAAYRAGLAERECHRTESGAVRDEPPAD